MMFVRAEAEEDRPAIREINERAFGRAGEADLVEALRASARPYISLVAVCGGRAVGHILFSPVSVVAGASGGAARGALALGPMAVLPEFQNRGVGSELVRRGLDECRRLGHEAVVVVGHPAFYPRFGFVPARARGLECEYPVPDEVFMAAELREGALDGLKGLVKYHPEFGKV
jgi:putative acetyltransferase